MNEDIRQINLFCNSLFAYPCQFCVPYSSWAALLQALVSATQKTPEATKPYSEEAATDTAATGVVV